MVLWCLELQRFDFQCLELQCVELLRQQLREAAAVTKNTGSGRIRACTPARRFLWGGKEVDNLLNPAKQGRFEICIISNCAEQFLPSQPDVLLG